MKRILHILLIITLLTNGIAKGQQKYVDIEVKKCYTRAIEATSNTGDSTLFFISRGIELCTIQDDLDKEVFFHAAKILYFMRHGEYEHALDELNVHDSIAEILDNDNFRQSGFMFRGEIYHAKGMYINALNNYYSAVDIYQSKIEDKNMIVDVITKDPLPFDKIYDPRLINLRVLTDIACIMREIGSYDKAIEYIQKIKDDIEEHGSWNTTPILPKTLKELAYSYAMMEDERAELTFIELRHLLQNHDWEEKDLLLFECYEGLANIYIKRGRLGDAKQIIAQCRMLAYNLGNPQYEARYHNLSGRLFRESGLYEKCIEECKTAYSIDSNSYFTAATATYNIARAYDVIGDKKMADHYFDIHNRNNIKKSNRNYQESFADLERLYGETAKDIKIKQLSDSQRSYTIIIFSFILILLLAILSIIVLVKMGRRNSQLEAARAVIDGELKERKRVSKDLHDCLIGDLVAVKNNVFKDSEQGDTITKMLDGCIEEVRNLAHGIMPPALKYELKIIFEDLASHYDNVTFHFYGKDFPMDERAKYALFCIVNELINNAQRHGEAKHIDLQLIENDEFLSICVQDDGCGFDPQTTTEGFGLTGIRSRIEPYSGTLTIESKPGEGSEITVTIKELYR